MWRRRAIFCFIHQITKTQNDQLEKLSEYNTLISPFKLNIMCFLSSVQALICKQRHRMTPVGARAGWGPGA